MTDESNAEETAGSQDAGPTSEAPTPEAPRAAVGDSSAGEPPRRSRGFKILVAAVALIVVAAGSSLAVVLTSNSGGGGGGNSSPSTAVAALLTAADKSDLLGALDALDPGERAALVPSSPSILANLIRLHVLSSSANLSDVAGVHFNFTGARTKTTFLTPDLAEVGFTGGKVTASADVTKLPLGSFVQSVAGKALQHVPAQSQTSSLSSGKEGIATVNVNGHWYVSLGYTVAVDALLSSGKSAAPPSGGVTAVGASSSTGAVQSLFNAMANLNVNDIVAAAPPDEMAALQAYAPLYLSKVDSGAKKARQAATITITNLGMTTSAVSDGTLVKIGSIGISASVEGLSVALNIKGGCISGTLVTKKFHDCGNTAGSAKVLQLLPAALRQILARLGQIHPQIGFVTVEENGKWYVSPTRTFLEDLNAYLTQLQPGDLTMIANNLPAIKKAFGPAGQKALQQQLQNQLGSVLS